ncbi:MAG TPA: exodeoxyribonuclease VII large subunit [Clostridia bacterium]|nr:exodeoxyribonuclease VII large subunit [Clostridia bacterium]
MIGPILEVWEVTQRVRGAIASDPVLSGIGVRGQIANFRKHSSGHIYFTLRDERASLRSVMFRSRASGLGFTPKDGMRVVAFGYLDVFERDGTYQLYVDAMRQDGLGALHVALEELKQKLQAEGLMDPARKRRLPLLPRKVGIVTSKTGAAIHDISSVARRRFPGCRIVLLPVRVQGSAAPDMICKAVRTLERVPEVDVIVVARGGGSEEDLSAFNDERVVRAIYGSSVPVVSAVGHEVDVTLSDLVADVRAPTPSAAAEMVFPSAEDLKFQVRNLYLRARAAVHRRMERAGYSLMLLRSRPPLSRPLQLVFGLRQRIDGMEARAAGSVKRILETKRAMYLRILGRAEALDPYGPLMRGYALCLKKPDEIPISSVDMIQRGDGILLLLKDGRVDATVKEVSRVSWRMTW